MLISKDIVGAFHSNGNEVEPRFGSRPAADKWNPALVKIGERICLQSSLIPSVQKLTKQVWYNRHENVSTDIRQGRFAVHDRRHGLAPCSGSRNPH
jgi:hypothetical protein